MKTNTNKTTKKITKKLRPFRRASKHTDEELAANFQIYVASAVQAYRKEEKEIESYATKDRQWGKDYGNKSINFFQMMLNGLKDFMEESDAKYFSLGMVCDECGASQDDCDCEHPKEDDDEDDEDAFEIGTSDRFGGK